MSLSSIEVLAAILIIISIMKITVMIVSPKTGLNFVKKIYSMPEIVTVIGFLLSVLVLYFIINAGISIVEMLAVCLFIALLMIAGLADYANEFIAWLKNQEFSKIIKRIWLYSAIWLFLIVWGAYALLEN